MMARFSTAVAMACLMTFLNLFVLLQPGSVAAANSIHDDKFTANTVSASGNIQISADTSTVTIGQVNPANPPFWKESTVADFKGSSELTDVDVIAPHAGNLGYVELSYTTSIEKNVYVPNSYNNIFCTYDFTQNPPVAQHYQVVAQTFVAPATGLVKSVEIPIYKVQWQQPGKQPVDPYTITNNGNVVPAPVYIDIVMLNAFNGFPNWPMQPPAKTIATASLLPTDIGTVAKVWQTFTFGVGGMVFQGQQYAFVVWSDCQMNLAGQGLHTPAYRWETSVVNDYNSGDVWGKNKQVRNGNWFKPGQLPSGSDYDCPFKLTVKMYKDSGRLVSKVFDTTSVQNGISTFGNVLYQMNNPANTMLTISLRTGNTAVPDASWSGWKNPNLGQLPSARYVQYKVDMSSTSVDATPVFFWIQVNYIPTVGWFESVVHNCGGGIDSLTVSIDPQPAPGQVQVYVRARLPNQIDNWKPVSLDTVFDFDQNTIGGPFFQYRIELLPDPVTNAWPTVDLVTVTYTTF